MKVAYIYFLMEDASFGVLQKVRQQGAAISRAGIKDLDILVINPSIEEQVGNLRFIRFKGSSFYPLRVLYYLFNKRALIENAVDLSPYHSIVLRLWFSDGSLLRMVRHRPVILEFHSKIITELKVKVAERSTPVRKLIRLLRIAIEKRYLQRLVRSCAGIITMGTELAAYYGDLSGGNCPCRVISNGCDVSGMAVTGFRQFDGQELHIVFLGSRPDPWHGLDRLTDSMRHYASSGGNVKVNLHLVGGIVPADLGMQEPEVGFHFHGMLSGEELDAVMSRMNLAVCSLAQHLKQLDETSAIKTVEYLARGLPFIIGYQDTALTGKKELEDTYLQYPNDRSAIDLNDIISFCTEAGRNRDGIIARMRNHAEQHCDWSIKMQEYADFARAISKIEDRKCTGVRSA